MDREQVLQAARDAGMVVKSCTYGGLIAVRGDKAHDPNERMRLTSNGALLNVSEGYYWQLGTVEDLADHLKARTQ